MARPGKNLSLFRLSFLLNSTALVMPILPFWWTESMGVSMEVYLGVLSMVSVGALVLDLPLSALADRIGAKLTYVLGLGVFSLSFLIASRGQTVEAFYLYGLSNAFAEGLISGSNNALLKSVVGEESYRDELYTLNRWYYLLTSLQFFLGVFLYLRAPRVLLLLQAVMLFGACLSVSAITVDSAQIPFRKRDRQGAHGIKLSKLADIGFVKYLVGTLALCLLFGYFNGLMQFQNRTIQLLSGQFSLGMGDPLWTVAVFLFLGNVLTSLGVGKRVEHALGGLSTAALTLAFLLGAIVASARPGLSASHPTGTRRNRDAPCREATGLPVLA